MAETLPTWVSCQDPTCYTPQDMRLHDARLVCAEGVVISTGTELEVTPHLTDPLCVNVAAGGAWVDADLGGDCQGVYGVHNCDTTTVCTDDGDPTDPRIDRLVFQVNDSSLGGLQCNSELVFILGAPSPAPVAPPEPDNAITLALVTVTAEGITDVSDARTSFEVCGVSGRVPENVVYQPTTGAGVFVKANHPDAVWFEVLMVGGGGGAGGATIQNAGNLSTSVGGGGGAGIRLRVPYDEMPDEVAWSVGAGGGVGGGGPVAGGPGNPGGAGGGTVFGDWTAGGGGGGAGGLAGSSTPDVRGGTAGGSIITGSFANPPLMRADGDPAPVSVRLNAAQFYTGAGGDGPFGLGKGGRPLTTQGSGLPGVGDGAGGSGAAAGSATGFAGGAGASGRLVVTAYY